MNGTMNFADIANNPLLVPRKISGKLAYTLHGRDRLIFDSMIPMVEIDEQHLEFDMRADLEGGFVPMVAPGTETPLFHRESLGKRYWKPGEWRQKAKLTEADIHLVRKMGTESTDVKARQMMERRRRALVKRMKNTEEFHKRSMVIDQELSMLVADGNRQVIPVPKPDFLRPQVAVSWDAALANPMIDLQTTIADVNEFSGFRVNEVMLPARTLERTANNTELRTIMQNTFTLDSNAVSTAAPKVMRIMSEYLGSGVSMAVRDEAINIETMILAPVAAGATSILVDSASHIEAGAIVTIVDPTTNIPVIERAVVSVAPVRNLMAQYTLTLSAPTTNAFPVNAILTSHMNILPRDKALISGIANDVENDDPMIDPEYFDRPMDFAACPNHFESLTQPRKGVWGFAYEPPVKPPRLEYHIGLRGGGRIHYTTAWAVPVIFF